MEFKEEIRNLRNERVYRIKTGVIIGGGLLLLVLGVILFLISIKYDIKFLPTIGIFLITFVFPVSLLYPLVRFFMGGRDSVLGVVISIVLEEYMKGTIKKHMKDDRKR